MITKYLRDIYPNTDTDTDANPNPNPNRLTKRANIRRNGIRRNRPEPLTLLLQMLHLSWLHTALVHTQIALVRVDTKNRF